MAAAGQSPGWGPMQQPPSQHWHGPEPGAGLSHPCLGHAWRTVPAATAAVAEASPCPRRGSRALAPSTGSLPRSVGCAAVRATGRLLTMTQPGANGRELRRTASEQPQHSSHVHQVPSLSSQHTVPRGGCGMRRRTAGSPGHGEGQGHCRVPWVQGGTGHRRVPTASPTRPPSSKQNTTSPSPARQGRPPLPWQPMLFI